MMNRNLEKPLAASALALEAAASALLCAAGGAQAVVWAAVAHALGAACAAAFLSHRAARLQVADAGRGAWLLFVTASVALPVAGPLALAALVGKIARGRDEPDAALARSRLNDAASVIPLATDAPSDIGRGSLEARLRFDPSPASRIAAVLATRRLHAPADAIRLLKLALRDRHEDVRLLAHALLEDRDRQAFRRIEETERELATAAVGRRGPLECLLAEALYDLCASGLATGELESFTLRRARALLERARSVPPMQGSASAALLLGRVLLRQGLGHAARAAIAESGRLGTPPELLAPHLAEASFQTRRLGAGGEGA